MIRKIFASMVIFASIYGHASADAYFGVSYSRVDLDGAEPTALDLKIGKQVNDFFSVEGRIGVPLGEDTVELFPGFDVDVEEEHLGVLGRFGNSFYALVGFMDVTINVSSSIGSGEDSESDLVAGLGFEVGDDNGFAFEYLAGTGDLEDISWLNLGYFNHF